MKTNQINIIRITLAIISLIFLNILLTTAWAEELGKAEFDSEIIYDIYCQSAEKTIMNIGKVHILGTKQLGNITFLVVRKDGGFHTKKEEAYINLTCVKSILPSYFDVQMIRESSKDNK
jgi:hypothetical protein